MNVPFVISGFWLGTFKFLFAHWLTYWAADGFSYTPHFYEIFGSVTVGAWVSMSVFYFTSELLMKRAAKKRHETYIHAKVNGIELKQKKKFTKMNKLLVKMKRSIGIYGLTLFAPLFLSIPIGSIVCAKFFGHEKKTFPLMLLFTGLYSLVMCLLIELIK